MLISTDSVAVTDNNSLPANVPLAEMDRAVLRPVEVELD